MIIELETGRRTMTAKKPVELTPAQLKRFERCYAVYRKKGQRGTDELTWAKYDFDEQMTEKIWQAIIAQNKADQGATPKKFLRGFSVWLNNKGWLDEIESQHTQEENKQPASKCKCGNKSAHSNGDCDQCLSRKLVKESLSLCADRAEMLKKFYFENNLAKQEGESKGQWIKRLSAVMKDNIKRIGQ